MQRALRRALGELMQQFGDLTGDVPQQLGEADRAMRDADESLREGRDARDAQQRAIRALTEGGRQMAQQMQRQFGQGQPGEGEEEGEGEGEGMAGDQQGGEGQDQAQEQGQGRDPLGRRNREATGGQDNASDTRVPDEAELLKTRRIQEELRRRGAERERPPAGAGLHRQAAAAVLTKGRGRRTPPNPPLFLELGNYRRSGPRDKKEGVWESLRNLPSRHPIQFLLVQRPRHQRHRHAQPAAHTARSAP